MMPIRHFALVTWAGLGGLLATGAIDATTNSSGSNAALKTRQLGACVCSSTSTTANPTIATSNANTSMDEDFCVSVKEMVIAVDSSASVSESNFFLVRESLQALISRLPMPDVQVGVVRFSNLAVEISALEDRSDVLRARLSGMAYSSGESLLAPALQSMAVTLSGGLGQVLAAGPGQVALVILDGPPSDLAEASAAALDLKEAGVRVMLLWVDGAGEAGAPPTALQGIASGPPSENVFSAVGFGDLARAFEALLLELQVPCPCAAGQVAYVPSLEGGHLVGIGLLRDTAHGASVQQDCSSSFPAYSGQLSVVCRDGSLSVDTSHCALACAAGATLNISAGVLVGSIVTEQRLASGAVTDIPCEDAFGSDAAGSGSVRVQCQSGEVSASHACALRCPENSDSVLAMFGDSSATLSVPSGGIAHRTWTSHSCASLFNSASGHLAITCLHGEIQVAGRCLPADESCASLTSWQLQFGALGLWVISGIAFIAAAILCFTARHWRKQPPIVKQCDEVFCEVVPAVSLFSERDAGIQTDAIPTKVHTAGFCQTEPQVHVELEPGPQLPLDLVCCIDSSWSVGLEGFQLSVRFVEELAWELEMPAVRVGVVAFNHNFAVTSPLTSERSELQARLAAMRYEPGETKLAGPLQRASDMLFCRNAAAAPRDRAVVVIMHGDPSDAEEAVREAHLLKSRGARLLFLQVGPPAGSEAVRQSASVPVEKFCLVVPTYHELSTAQPELLSRVVQLSQQMRRARCQVDLVASLQAGQVQQVTDLDAIPGFELMVPGWQKLPAEEGCPESQCGWMWDPSSQTCLASPSIARWDTHCRPVEPPEPESQSQDFGAQAAICAADSGAQTESSAPASAPRESQTDPVVNVSLAPGRHAQLDLVVCIDNSASISLARHLNPEDCAVAESGTFRRIKEFVETLACAVHMQDVRLALVRFEAQQEVICELTPALDTFRDGLRSVTASLGMTNLAPPLWQGLGMLGGSSAEAKAVLLITDGDPNDLEEATEAAGALRACGAQMLIVRVAKADDGIFNSCGQCRGLAELAGASNAIATGEASTAAAAEAQALEAQRALFEVADEAQALAALVPTLLRRMLRVSRHIVRARCTLPLEPYEVVGVEDESSIGGYEVQLPNVPVFHPSLASWDPTRPVLPSQSQQVSATPTSPVDSSGYVEAVPTSEPNKQELAWQLEHVELEVKRLTAELATRRMGDTPEAAEARAAANTAERLAKQTELASNSEAMQLDAQVSEAEATAREAETIAKEEEARAETTVKRADVAERMRESCLLQTRALEAEARVQTVMRLAEETVRKKDLQADDMQRKLAMAVRSAEQAAHDREVAERERRMREADLQTALAKVDEVEVERDKWEKQVAQEREGITSRAEEEIQAAQQRAEEAERTAEVARQELARAQEVEQLAERAKEAESEALKRAEHAEKELEAMAQKEQPLAQFDHISFNAATGRAVPVTELEYVKTQWSKKSQTAPTAEFADQQLALAVLAELASIYAAHHCSVVITYNARHPPQPDGRRPSPAFEQWFECRAQSRAELARRGLIGQGVPGSKVAINVIFDADEPTHIFDFAIAGQEALSIPASEAPSRVEMVVPAADNQPVPIARLFPDPEADRGLRLLKRDLEEMHGDLNSAFRWADAINGCRCNFLTMTKAVNAMMQAGRSKYDARALFKRMTVLAQCSKRGDVRLEDWHCAFEECSGAIAEEDLPALQHVMFDGLTGAITLREPIQFKRRIFGSDKPSADFVQPELARTILKDVADVCEVNQLPIDVVRTYVPKPMASEAELAFLQTLAANQASLVARTLAALGVLQSLMSARAEVSDAASIYFKLHRGAPT